MFDYTIYEKAIGSILILSWTFSAMITLSTTSETMQSWGWKKTMSAFMLSIPLTLVITARMIFGEDVIWINEEVEQIIKDIS